VAVEIHSKKREDIGVPFLKLISKRNVLENKAETV